MLAFNFAYGEPFAVQEDLYHTPAHFIAVEECRKTGLTASVDVRVLVPELVQVARRDIKARPADVIWQAHRNCPLLLAAMDLETAPSSGEPMDWLGAEGVSISGPEIQSHARVSSYVWPPGPNRDRILEWLDGNEAETNSGIWYFRVAAMHPTKKCVGVAHERLTLFLEVDLTVQPAMADLMSGGWLNILRNVQAMEFMTAVASNGVLMSIAEVQVMGLVLGTQRPDHDIECVDAVEGVRVVLVIDTTLPDSMVTNTFPSQLARIVPHNVLASWMSRCPSSGSNSIRKRLGLPHVNCSEQLSGMWLPNVVVDDLEDTKGVEDSLPVLTMWYDPYCEQLSSLRPEFRPDAVLDIEQDCTPVRGSPGPAVWRNPQVVKPWALAWNPFTKRTLTLGAVVGSDCLQFEQTMTGAVDGWTLCTNSFSIETARVRSLLETTVWNGLKLTVTVKFTVLNAIYRVISLQHDAATLQLVFAPGTGELFDKVDSEQNIDWNAPYAQAPSDLEDLCVPSEWYLNRLHTQTHVPMGHLRSVGLQYTWLKHPLNAACLPDVAPGWTCDWNWLLVHSHRGGWDVLEYIEQHLREHQQWFVCAEELAYHYENFKIDGVSLERVAAAIEVCQSRLRHVCDSVITADAKVSWTCAFQNVVVDPPLARMPMNCVPQTIQVPIN